MKYDVAKINKYLMTMSFNAPQDLNCTTGQDRISQFFNLRL